MGRIRIIIDFLEQYCEPKVKYNGISPEELAKILNGQLEAYEDFQSEIFESQTEDYANDNIPEMD